MNCDNENNKKILSLVELLGIYFKYSAFDSLTAQYY